MPPAFRVPAPRIEGSEKQVQLTNDDAQISKLSCVRAGYFDDNFVQYFVRRASRRSPLINRGYYSRFASLRLLLRKFLAVPLPHVKQILSLGAGFDTTWFHLQSKGECPCRYFEVDFKDVTCRKVEVIQQTPALQAVLAAGEGDTVDAAGGRIITSNYSLVPVDLRDTDVLAAQLQSAGFDLSAPTLVVSECVLVYMEPAASNKVVAWLAAHLPCAVMVVYEQIHPHDAFGRQMVSNLESRGCPLRGISATPTLDAHKQRMTVNGWRHADAWDMHSLYCSYLDPADKARMQRLELFDEFEEWQMIQEHYCVVVAVNDGREGGKALLDVTFTPLAPAPPPPLTMTTTTALTPHAIAIGGTPPPPVAPVTHATPSG